MAVFFKCKCCGGVHRAPIEFANEQHFERTQIGREQIFPCRRSGKSASYAKADMEWRETEVKGVE